MSNIYQIKQDLLDIFYEIEENGGELTEELEQQLIATQESFKDKVEDYVNVVKLLTSDIESIKTEQKRLKELSDRKQKIIDRLKSVIINAVEEFGDTKKSGVKYVDYGTGEVSIRTSKAVEVDNDAADLVADSVHMMINDLYLNNQLYVLNYIDKHNLLDIISSTKANDKSIVLNYADLDNCKIEISTKIPVSDLTNGKAFDILRQLAIYTRDYSIDASINKSELKKKLEENGSCAPHLAKLVINKNISIK